MAEQIPLSLKLSDSATFENFFPGANIAVLNFLKSYMQKPAEFLIYLWGREGAGRTHLLQACCHYQMDRTAIYIDLTEKDLTPEFLTELENVNLICLDNIDHVFKNAAWELALFNLYNRAYSQNSHLIIAGLTQPLQSNCCLIDLRSRLCAGLVLQLNALNDEQKILALQKRAENRGLFLSVDSAQFLLNHYPRHTHALFSALEILDQASMVNKHRLTIPFIKRILKISTLR